MNNNLDLLEELLLVDGGKIEISFLTRDPRFAFS